MKTPRRGRFGIALESLRKRFKPNPPLNAPAIDVEMARDIHHRPARAKKCMHTGKQTLQHSRQGSLRPMLAIGMQIVYPPPECRGAVRQASSASIVPKPR